MRRRIVRLVALLALPLGTVMTALFGVLSLPLAAGTPSETGVLQIYAYDGHHYSAGPAYTTTGRAPPRGYDYNTAHRAVDRWSYRASVRADTGTTPASIAYGHLEPLVHVGDAVTTTQDGAGSLQGRLSPWRRSDVAANNGRRSVAIGEDMTNRVEPFANRIGADTYKADPTAPREMWMKNNRDWIRKQMDDGCTIYDCGPAPGRSNFPDPTSPYYQMELDEIGLRNYPFYIRVPVD